MPFDYVLSFYVLRTEVFVLGCMEGLHRRRLKLRGGSWVVNWRSFVSAEFEEIHFEVRLPILSLDGLSLICWLLEVWSDCTTQTTW